MEFNRVAQGGAPSTNLELGTSMNTSARTPDQSQQGQEEVKSNQKSTALNKRDAQMAVDGLNKLLNSSNAHLKFEFHEKLNEYYVTIVDDETKEVVREIPPKKLLDMVAAMWQQIGLIVDKKI